MNKAMLPKNPAITEKPRAAALSFSTALGSTPVRMPTTIRITKSIAKDATILRKTPQSKRIKDRSDLIAFFHSFLIYTKITDSVTGR